MFFSDKLLIFFRIFSLLILFFLIFQINKIYAQGNIPPTLTGPGLEDGKARDSLSNTLTKEKSIIKIIVGWTNFFLSFVSVLAIASFIYAGFLYIIDIGDGTRKGTAEKVIMWTIIGIIFIMIAYALTYTVMNWFS